MIGPEEAKSITIKAIEQDDDIKVVMKKIEEKVREHASCGLNEIEGLLSSLEINHSHTKTNYLYTKIVYYLKNIGYKITHMGDEGYDSYDPRSRDIRISW